MHGAENINGSHVCPSQTIASRKGLQGAEIYFLINTCKLIILYFRYNDEFESA